MQDPRGDVRATLGLLGTNGLGDLACEAVTRFAEGRGPVQTIPPDEVPPLRSAISELRDGYLRARTRIVARSSDHAYDRYLHALDVALQALSLFDAPSQMNAYYKRETLAAANVEWIAATVGGPVVIWAHNTHVAKDNDVPEFVTLGKTLAKAHGSEYFAMGSAFFDGSVRAVSAGKLIANEVEPPRVTEKRACIRRVTQTQPLLQQIDVIQESSSSRLRLGTQAARAPARSNRSRMRIRRRNKARTVVRNREGDGHSADTKSLLRPSRAPINACPFRPLCARSRHSSGDRPRASC